MPGANAWNRLRYTLYAPIYDFALARVPVFARGRRRAIEDLMWALINTPEFVFKD